MATWTTIPDSSLEPGKPIRSIDALALRDNPVAIAEGASGAPKIQTLALQPPVAGNDFLIYTIQDALGSTDLTSYLDVGFHRTYSSNAHMGVVALVGGTIRVSFEHRVSGGLSGNSTARILKNGSQVIEWTTSSTTFVQRTADVTVETGDVVIIQQKTTTQTTWRNLRVYSTNKNIAVA